MQNQTVIQFYHWYFSKENKLWKHVAQESGRIQRWGFSHVWLPPAYKSSQGADEPGYAVYDLYDLGEFDQKGSVATKYGTREELHEAIEALQQKGIKVIADVVLNHRMRGDEQEKIQLQAVNEDERMQTEGEAFEAEKLTRFTFLGRAGKYSSFIWDHHCFSGLKNNGQPCMILNEYSAGGWTKLLSDEKGSFDYLMGNDVDFRNPAVREELANWGKWFIQNTVVDGLRLDGLKHIDHNFFNGWLPVIKDTAGKDLLVIGEFWKNKVDTLLRYIDATGGNIQLFDVPLHFNFYEAAEKGADYDLRQLADNTLMQCRPDKAITFVDNHDTQPFQSLESWVAEWFKPHAYAFILLRREGIPCVFYTTMYGAKYSDKKEGEQEEKSADIKRLDCIETLLNVRHYLAYGGQHSNMEQPNAIGWGREGDEEHEHSGCAVLLSNKDDAALRIFMGKANAGKIFIDCGGDRGERITIDGEGIGNFHVNACQISVWINEEAKNNICH